MSNKGNNRHIKRLASSRYMAIERKKNKYLINPDPGRFGGESCIAIATVLKEKLGVADNSRETRYMLRSGKVMVNGDVVKEEKYPVGLSDVISLKGSDEAYSIGIGKYGSIKIEKADGVAKKEVKVVGKYLSKGRKEMIRLYNGDVMGAGGKAVNINDSVVLEGKKIVDVLKLDNGSKCVVIKGRHAPAKGTIRKIIKGTMLRASSVEIEPEHGEKFETVLENIMVVSS